MLVSLGLDFRQARLEVRERFHLEDEDVARIRQVLAVSGVRELVLARTCNRIEAYCWWPAARSGRSHPDPGRVIAGAWVGGDPGAAEALLASARLLEGDTTARHLFRVAAGLESQILGDIHILGQLRRAFREALDACPVGSELHRLFEIALRVGKQVKRETRLMATRPSVGFEAARRASRHWGDLSGRPCVVVGCGKSGTHAARSLHELGATHLTVVNRTAHRAEKLARDLGNTRAADLEALPEVLEDARVIVVATGAPKPVLTQALLRRARSGAEGGPEQAVLVIDVAVPRNVEASVGGLPGVELVDLDRLHPEAAHVEKSRLASVPEAEELVEEGVREFACWLELQAVRRALGPLHSVLSQVCHRELSHLAGESASVRRAADRIVARVMSHPMAALRAASDRGEPVEETAGALGQLFAGSRSSGLPDLQ